jgi:hypothetical protein
VIMKVDGVNEESFNIDVTDVSEASVVRNKIFRKFNVMDPRERKLYALYLVHGDSCKFYLFSSYPSFSFFKLNSSSMIFLIPQYTFCDTKLI